METRRWIDVTILLALVALLLQVAGFLAPMWIWLDVGNFQVGVGLWYTRGCGISGTCNTTEPALQFGYSDEDTFAKPEYDAVRALETLGVAGGVLLLLFLVVYRIGYGKWDRMNDLNRASFILCVLTWIVILAGLIVYCGFYWPVVGTSPLLNSRSFPWSILFCLFAALVFIIICVLIRVKCRTSEYVKHAIPISGDAKMDLHPVTKTGLLNRYFTPSPYREDRRTTYAVSAYYEDGGADASRMSRRLISPEERLVSTVDNGRLQGTTAVENGTTYRYLPVANVGATQTETVVRRSVPTGVVTVSSDASNINQLQAPQYQPPQTTTRVISYVTENATNQQVGTANGGVAYANGGIPSPRDSGLIREGYVGGTREYVTREGGGDYTTREVVTEHVAVPRPTVITTREYVTSAPQYVTTQREYVTTAAQYAPGPRDTKLADNTTDERFTMEGRLMANVNPEVRNDRGGMSSQWETSTASGWGSRGQYTTHTLMQTGQGVSGTKIILPQSGSSVKMYDPTYIYRPYSEQVY